MCFEDSEAGGNLWLDVTCVSYEDEAEHASEVCFKDQVSIELFARIKQSTRVRGVSVWRRHSQFLGFALVAC